MRSSRGSLAATIAMALSLAGTAVAVSDGQGFAQSVQASATPKQAGSPVSPTGRHLAALRRQWGGWGKPARYPAPGWPVAVDRRRARYPAPGWPVAVDRRRARKAKNVKRNRRAQR